MGTSIQVGEGDGMYRLHIHVPTENRYTPIEYTMKLGTITKVSIENLMAQMEDIEQGKEPTSSTWPPSSRARSPWSRFRPARASRASLPAWAWPPWSKAGKP